MTLSAIAYTDSLLVWLENMTPEELEEWGQIRAQDKERDDHGRWIVRHIERYRKLAFVQKAIEAGKYQLPLF